MPHRLPSLVVFDLAGTTMQDDGTVAAIFRDVLAAEGLPATPEEIAAVRGASKKEAFRTLAQNAERGGRLYARFVDGIHEQYVSRPPREVPGASTTFAWLRRHGAKVALNTGFERGIASVLVSALGWDGATIDATVCGDEVAAGRPSPAMILEAMHRTGILDPARVMVVGDTVLDLQAGTAARAGWVVGVTSGAHDRARLLQAPHTQLLDSVADIPALFTGC